MIKRDDAPNPPPEEVLHSIGGAAEAAGLTPQALRMWEERYGRPVAVRLPSGHRRYTEQQVRWLRRVADALAQGHRAGAVVPLDEDALTALLAEAAPPETLGKGPRVMLDWIASYGADEIRAWLDARWDADKYLKFLNEEVAPLVVAVGRGWADGELDVQHEHFLSEILDDELRRLRLEFGRAPGAPTVILTTLPEELHGLGLQMTALGAAAHGLAVRVLGVNTPIESILKAAEEIQPAIVAVGTSSNANGAETYRMLRELRRALPAGIRLVVGGGGVQTTRRSPKGVECAKDLEAWDAIVAALARDAATSRA
jgi:methanogenic corrinoid protein MtbC1